jgi:hypothetical protein
LPHATASGAPYVSYTRRLPLVENFTPDEAEDRLYELVSDYLRRDNLQALPSSQRSLMTLVMRKLLASSTFAIAGALDTLVNRLEARLARQTARSPLIEERWTRTTKPWTKRPKNGPTTDPPEPAVAGGPWLRSSARSPT